ncbi:hypothetical protein MUK42_29859 [Musa troglodytarum]|uniref:Uncharacterized protein n=1 Tax=Musa troglodytarum TaxID=320322 RepID=A0A9E7F713_9LILI|nr:hypothetical protein MUK42_29859 [Musa troglodytarum]
MDALLGSEQGSAEEREGDRRRTNGAVAAAAAEAPFKLRLDETTTLFAGTCEHRRAPNAPAVPGFSWPPSHRRREATPQESDAIQNPSLLRFLCPCPRESKPRKIAPFIAWVGGAAAAGIGGATAEALPCFVERGGGVSHAAVAGEGSGGGAVGPPSRRARKPPRPPPDRDDGVAGQGHGRPGDGCRPQRPAREGGCGPGEERDVRRFAASGGRRVGLRGPGPGRAGAGVPVVPLSPGVSGAPPLPPPLPLRRLRRGRRGLRLMPGLPLCHNW